MSVPLPRSPIWLVHIHHEGGEDYSIRSSELGVDAAVRDWCLTWWHEIADQHPDISEPASLRTAELIRRYFGSHPVERLNISPLELDAPFHIGDGFDMRGEGPTRIH